MRLKDPCLFYMVKWSSTITAFTEDGRSFYFATGASRRNEDCCKVQLGRLMLDMRRKKYRSVHSAVVQQAILGESGSAHGFVFQGTAREVGGISRGVGFLLDIEKKERFGCPQSSRKQQQAWIV